MTAAVSLVERGFDVTLCEAGSVPNPLAASTDISKVVRMEYGPDVHYMALMEAALAGWHEWNDRWAQAGGRHLYHETGVLMACRDEMTPGGFEYESYHNLLARGHAPERITPSLLRERFPVWNADRFVDGFFHARGGYAESGRVLQAITSWLCSTDVTIREQAPVAEIRREGAFVRGLTLASGERLDADVVVVAAGAWVPALVPELSTVYQPTGHPVFHLRPTDRDLFDATRFPTFTADISRTGFYGFPITSDGVVKVANHGVGRALGPDEPRELDPADEPRLRRFLREYFPTLADAEVVFTRLCLYADTQDGDFWIDQHPDLVGLVVAGGGSGHGFKYAPILGDMIADIVQGKATDWRERFRWRPEVRCEVGREAARCHTYPTS